MSSAEGATAAPQFTDLPVPRSDCFSYRFNRVRALVTSPRRLANYLKWTWLPRAAIPRHLPVQLAVEPVSRCNLACRMCIASEWPNGKRADDMTLTDFKGLLDANPGLLELKLHGSGEPLLNADVLFEMIRHARSRSIWVRVATNGTLLHINDNYRRLPDSGVNEIQVSIDGATREVYESIRRGADFEQVFENCRQLNRYCRTRRRPRPLMWVVLQTANIHQLRDFVELAKRLEFEKIGFGLALSDWGREEWSAKIKASQAGGAVTAEQLKTVQAHAKKLKIKAGFMAHRGLWSTDSPATLCPRPFDRPMISSDMRIAPCCLPGSPDVVCLGDARNFAAAWRAQPYRDFRRLHLEKRIPVLCRSCYRD